MSRSLEEFLATQTIGKAKLTSLPRIQSALAISRGYNISKSQFTQLPPPEYVCAPWLVYQTIYVYTLNIYIITNPPKISHFSHSWHINSSIKYGLFMEDFHVNIF